MTTAVGKMLKQAEQLSTAEQWELAVRLNERLKHQAESVPAKADLLKGVDAASQAQTGVGPSLLEETEDDEIPDVFSLNRVPPQRTYTMRVKYKFVGQGKPRHYPLDDEE